MDKPSGNIEATVGLVIMAVSIGLLVFAVLYLVIPVIGRNI